MVKADHQETTPGAHPQPEHLPGTPNPSMQEYYRLQLELLTVTLMMTGVIFIAVWIFYSLNIALNYLLGACTGVVYLKMLAKSVEGLGRGKKSLGYTRLAVVGMLILVATQWNQLKLLPILLGFLTYKAAVIVYMLRTLLPQEHGS